MKPLFRNIFRSVFPFLHHWKLTIYDLTDGKDKNKQISQYYYILYLLYEKDAYRSIILCIFRLKEHKFDQ